MYLIFDDSLGFYRHLQGYITNKIRTQTLGTIFDLKRERSSKKNCLFVAFVEKPTEKHGQSQQTQEEILSLTHGARYVRLWARPMYYEPNGCHIYVSLNDCTIILAIFQPCKNISYLNITVVSIRFTLAIKNLLTSLMSLFKKFGIKFLKNETVK